MKEENILTSPTALDKYTFHATKFIDHENELVSTYAKKIIAGVNQLLAQQITIDEFLNSVEEVNDYPVELDLEIHSLNYIRSRFEYIFRDDKV